MSYVLYSHIGSGNRGCEATAKSLRNILNLDKNHLLIFSEDKDEELICKTEQYANVLYTPQVNNIHPIGSIVPRILSKSGLDSLASVRYRYKRLFNSVKKGDIGLSTGGDVFCYNEKLSSKIGYLTEKMNERAKATCLIACSIDKKYLNQKTVDILKLFDYIFPRESLTEINLRDVGLKNVIRYPDPAFMLPIEEAAGLDFLSTGDYVGINYSIYTNGGQDKSDNYQTIIKLIDKILRETDMGVVLIPHVFWKSENDLFLLKQINQEFINENRVKLIDTKFNSSQLKYIISKCKFFIGSRTHSVIGAYSSGVPTLAIGYSIKSKGIAGDIFGDYHNYLFDSKKLNDFQALYNAFMYILNHEKDIKNKLATTNLVFRDQLMEQSNLLKELERR